ncbi:axin-1-like isoform X1 [Poecilia reticulata]|uniref:Axin-1 n=1 Tax=Poecilia reticulata TaxID=8081 RepID=A0A3P9MSG7_POERE|nr:PREDICTED: axin-1-like isoform X1 [Poecilia reticulata]XP_017161857.1 PREDICTED: axin-1-like isoform X1 [Poecilia reticulata]XP_017161860.1 PREDICTED: axin-1-like isoform X1 [Poecilia reticulata]
MSVVRDLHGVGYRGGGGVVASLNGPAHFTEDAPRPPVPGEEGTDLDPPVQSGNSRPGGLSQTQGYPSSKMGDPSSHVPSSSSSATPRRPDLDLGYEPEGSASPTPPYLKWAESLHSLLDDQDGTNLFRSFLCQEGCEDLVDFWFACSGFRQTSQDKRAKLAKVIYRKYIVDGSGIVSRTIKAATKSFIRDCVGKPHLDPAMFEQAQTEIQAMMEENTYPLFLKSDLYLEYTRTGGESPKPNPSDQSPSSGPAKPPPGYLPTLAEDVEWRGGVREEEEEKDEEDCGDTPVSRLTQSLLMQTAPQRASPNRRRQDSREYRPWREPVNPYYANMGYARAPVTSANDSEQQSMSSDADTMSLTDSSVDGIPPYRYRKQHRKEMHESAKANGRVPLPHIPRTYHIPKDIHVKPEMFAAELINRLEAVLRERDAQERLEERLKRVRLEEEGDDADVSMTTSMSSHSIPLPIPSSFPPLYGARYSETTANTGTATTYGGLVAMEDPHEDDPESILDEHVQRVMKTPGCQSPGATNSSLGGGGRHTPPKSSRSPDGGIGPPHYPSHRGGGQSLPTVGAKGIYHHKQVYHHRGRDGQEETGGRPPPNLLWNGDQANQYAGRRNYADGAGASTLEGMGYGSKGSTMSRRGFKKTETSSKADESGRGLETQGYPGTQVEDLERNQKILQWMMDGDRQRKSSHGGSTSSSRRTGTSTESPRPTSVERPGAVHPWVSAQLRNNSSSVSTAIPGSSSTQVQPSHPFIQDPAMPPNPAPNPLTQLEEARRRLEEERRRAALLQAKQKHKSGKRQVCENMTVAYYFCGEPIPYRTSVKGRVVTLGQFKELLTKKGHYRFYFKKVSDEFDCGVVFEEVRDDDAILPIFEEKIVGKVEKVD